MEYLQLILWGLGSLFLAAEAGGFGDENLFSSDGGAIYQAKNNFKCPLIFGAFPDPTDCAHYYVCVAGVAVHKKCGILQNFDVLRRRCLPILVAICGNDKTKTTPTPTVKSTGTTKTADNFKCPKMFGSFAHPTDCSKYYNCIVYVPSMQTCLKEQLFDTGKSTCRPEKEVDCGNRQRPGFTTIAIPTEPIVTEVPDTSTTEEEIIASTTEEEIIASTTEEEIIASTTEEIITTEVSDETTTEVSSTTRLRPTGPPDHTCDEDDVDCIITETGDLQDWFVCPRDIGSFTHPSSDRLFIFCMNWIPSVRKCGQDLVYSKEHRTCIEKKYFVKFFL